VRFCDLVLLTAMAYHRPVWMKYSRQSGVKSLLFIMAELTYTSKTTVAYLIWTSVAIVFEQSQLITSLRYTEHIHAL
jgi:hypothetical protein